MEKKKKSFITLCVSLVVIISVLSVYIIIYKPEVTVYAINDNGYPLNITIKINDDVVMNSQIKGWNIGVSGNKQIKTNVNVGDNNVQVFTINKSYQKTSTINIYHKSYLLIYFKIAGDVKISVENEEPHFR